MSTQTITRGDTMALDINDLGDLTGYVSIDFTVKEFAYEADTDAIIRIRLNASGVDDGLLRFNKAAETDDTLGSITIDDLTDGDITIALSATRTDDLAPQRNLHYDIQMITATAVETLLSARFTVSADITRAIT